MKRRSILPAVALAALTASTLIHPSMAQAQTDQAPQPDFAGSAAASVSPVVVTADRSPTPVDQVGQSVTVVTEPQIRLDQEIDVVDILARTPGVSVSRAGGPGETTSFFIRGAEAAQTVVLIDGVKVNDPTDPAAGADLSTVLAGDISRIEILRGPQSTLYGSEAIGGVVNIVTADATKPFQGDAQVEGGSYGTAYAKGAIGGKADRYDWRLGAYYNSTDGVSAFDRTLGGREDDGFHTGGVSGRFRYDLTPILQLDERVYYTASRNEFDGYDTATGNFGDDAEFGRTQQVVDYTGLNLSLFDGRLKNRLAYQYNELDRRTEDPNQPVTKFTFEALGRVDTIDYEGAFAIAPGYDAVFGAQSERSLINSVSPFYDPASVKANVTVNSGYGQVHGEVLPGLNLTAGVRYDAHSTFGDHVTGQASAAWALNGGNTIARASFGQGFKAPSLYQLYSQYGNLALRPEEANGWDAGVEQHLFDRRLTVQATYFGRETRNLIGFGVTALRPDGVYENIARTRAEGLELAGDWRVTSALDVSANYTFDDDEDRSPGSATRGQQLIRRPKDTANLAATYVWPVKLSTTVAVRYAGQSFDTSSLTFAPVVLGDYTLVDLRASYPLRPNLDVYARVENLADKTYETASGYGTLGRAGYAGLRIGF